MKIQKLPIESVIPYARNLRKNAAAIDKVAASLKEFGWQQPIVVDSERVIIVGHTRFLAAKQLGMTYVPVVAADNLTPAQVKAYRLADNRSHEEAEWDKELLAIELGELANLDFDLSLTAFNPDEVQGLMALAESIEQGLTEEDECPAISENPVSTIGDIWILGRHRVMCGDTTRIDDVDQLMDGALADMVFTDPPYNVN